MNMSFKRRGTWTMWILMVCVIIISGVVLFGPRLGTTRLKIGTIQSEGARLIPVIESYRNDTGALPVSLDALVPEYLPQVPDVSYKREKSYGWFYRLFDHDLKSPWAYKLSSDKSGFALAVEARTTIYYDSKSAEWHYLEEGFDTFK
jgi:hypothetical protein